MSVTIEYVPVASPVHRLHALTKLSAALAVLTISLIFHDPLSLSLLLLSLLALSAIAGVGRETLAAVKGLFKVALILILLQIFFISEGNVIVGPIAGLSWLTITDAGLLFGISMALRMITIVTSFLLFLLTTPMRSTVLALVEYLKVPYDYAFLFITSLRFIPTFLEEVRLIREAQEARAHDFGGGSLARLKAIFPLALPLVNLSLQRAERMAMAMETRGFGLPGRTYYRSEKLGVIDSTVIAALLLAVATAALRPFS
ncbi:energy-coupling factor transporter transmembrane protein EcfT [Heliobacterium gestii]|uniref:Energy-coupling factor transporter transmembrane protein EcfT n=1 Tax=Heliomicrobium gestii TaxID=2699 RepID=A0A845LD72_HELGE|nr:energy-coupling factor transporter transmembrane component T [Heliomicrobium gestii]MBM7866334.1 energy-coupling factor transport system permease protein [Heliomicrobium gestii]MZP42880.1 energy-coupling factor transporter transmembrane protein EcfT [Heliomicrobium gestii]